MKNRKFTTQLFVAFCASFTAFSIANLFEAQSQIVDFIIKVVLVAVMFTIFDFAIPFIVKIVSKLRKNR